MPEHQGVVLCQAGDPTWLELRKKYLTGSTGAAWLGKSPYATKEDVIAQKEWAASKKQRQRMWWGDYAELMNLVALGAWLGRGVLQDRSFVKHPEHPVACTLDGWVSTLEPEANADTDIGTGRPTLPEGLWIPTEMKNTEVFKFNKDLGMMVDTTDEWRYSAPEHYEIQLQTQLLVTGCRYGLVCAKLGAADMRAHLVEADDFLHADLIEASYEYQEHVF